MFVEFFCELRVLLLVVVVVMIHSLLLLLLYYSKNAPKLVLDNHDHFQL